MAKKPFFKKYPKIFRVLRFLFTFLLILGIAFTAYNLYYFDKIFPGIWIAGNYIGGKTQQEAFQIIQKKSVLPQKITLTNQTQNFDLDPSLFDASYNVGESIKTAFDFDRTGNFIYDFYQRLKAPFRQENLGLRINLNEDKLAKNLSVVAGEIANDPIYPSAKLVLGQITIDKGKPGQEVDIQKLRIDIGQELAFLENKNIQIPINTIDPTLNYEEEKTFEARAENLIGKKLDINFEFQTFPYKNNSLFPLLNPKDGYNEGALAKEIDTITSDVERSPQNPVFVFANGKVSQFAPAKDGIKIRNDEFKQKIIDSLVQLEKGGDKEVSFEIPVDRTQPEIKTSDVNDLGIKELIGRGVSHFWGSIPSRIYNVSLASLRINGSLVKPGETFSFNDALGDVSKFTGYQEAYIIQNGKTVLGDGGGVCQVSTTLFRAVLDAGLPVGERVAHAYRVGYYEQDSPPGFDATVYSPSPDFKFKNDTPGYILIQATPDIKNSTLVFELYGTKDGRIAKTTIPVVSDQVAPPDDLYQDDPTLPAGKIKQIDFKAWGAKVTFDYTVQRNDQIIYQKTFVSNYHPWQAIYLRGTGPAQQ